MSFEMSKLRKQQTLGVGVSRSLLASKEPKNKLALSEDSDPFGEGSVIDEESFESYEDWTPSGIEAFDKDLADTLESLQPDTWNNIPLCLVRSITALVNCLTQTNSRVSRHLARSQSTFKDL